MEWPLGLLLTPPVLAKYNALFQLLLRTKRVAGRLDDAFLSLLKAAGSRRPGGLPPPLFQLVELRRQMAHLLTNLQVRHTENRMCWRPACTCTDASAVSFSPLPPAAACLVRPFCVHTRCAVASSPFADPPLSHTSHLNRPLPPPPPAVPCQVYLQTDVIESNWRLLEVRMAAAQDFGEAEDAHRCFLADLVTQSFLSQSTICRNIGDVFGHVLELCSLVDGSHVGSGGGGGGEVDYEAAARVGHAFRAAAKMLYSGLRSIKLSTQAPHLHQLSMRLNFNEYMGKKDPRR